ncbi:MAG: HD domain-containing protein [Candidatus Shapirobacteria bacterium]
MILDLALLDPKKIDYWPELKSYAIETGLNPDEMEKCYRFAEKVHLEQKRESGEPFISHPAWVAKVVIQLGIGHKAAFAAMLHDCIEDTSATIEEIAGNFGDETALLVSGLTEVKMKTSGIEVYKTSIDVFRQFLFSSVNDVRVLIIRLVDKLHNGLTIKYLPKDRQIKYAERVMGIYGPVAEYVGLHYFKRLLEDIAFKILMPDEAERIQKLIEDQKTEEIRAMVMIRESISEMMKINNINNFEIQGRIKGLYSTYIKAKNKGEDRVKDRVGIRLLMENIEDCYTALGLLHSKYKYLPDEFNDYISNPKPNGYRSVQTTLNWKDKLTAEVQIRTKEMHEFDEFGPASHIVYKINKGTDEGMGLEWVKDLVKWQSTDVENVKNYRINVLKDYIYVFTPKGDTIQMPRGSTALDFAYRIHGDLGTHCGGAKINQKIAKINTPLETGDMVEILASKKKAVNRDWLDWVTTSFAKTQIRKETKE